MLIGYSRFQHGFCLINESTLSIRLTADANDCDVLGFNLAPCGFNSQPIITLINTRQNFARFDGFIVLRRNSYDIARNLAGYDGHIALHIGIFGRENETAMGQPIPACMSAISNHSDQNERADEARPALLGGRRLHHSRTPGGLGCGQGRGRCIRDGLPKCLIL